MPGFWVQNGRSSKMTSKKKSDVWTYGGVHGGSGGRYAIDRGEVWRVGDHFFAIGDLEGWEFDAYLRGFVFGEGSPFCVRGVYCDPPWNVGIAGLFRRSAEGFSDIGRGGSERVPVCLDSLFDVILQSCVDRGLLCAFEVGATGYAETYRACLRALRSAGRAIGGVGDDSAEPVLRSSPDDFRSAEVWYGSKAKPTWARVFCMDFSGRSGWSLDGHDWVESMDGHSDVKSVELYCDLLLAEFGQGVAVLDPCIGLGTTALGAARAGIASFGFDMSRQKVAAAMKSVSRVTGCDPMRVGVLSDGSGGGA